MNPLRVVHFTNVYPPHLSGVASGVETHQKLLLDRFHASFVVTIQVPGSTSAPGVTYIPAIAHNVMTSKHSLGYVSTKKLLPLIRRIKPHVIHSYQPFLLGDTARKVSKLLKIPHVFTHFTLYEMYVRREATKLAATTLATHHANDCNCVIAPSTDIEKHVRRHGVFKPVVVLPTGIPASDFAGGSKVRGRLENRIPINAFVIGHVGRLVSEKNIKFLSQAVCHYLKRTPDAMFLVIGAGHEEPAIQQIFAANGCSDRLIMTGRLSGQKLFDGYAAMDIFAFASHTETQGLVIAEAMAAHNPVVALDAPGIRDVVRDKVNGRLLPANSTPLQLAAAMHDARVNLQRYKRAAEKTAEYYSIDNYAQRIIKFYEAVRQVGP